MQAADFPLFFVFNAASGQADALRASERVQVLLAQAGRACQVELAQQPGDVLPATVRAVHAAREAGGAVVAAGGDGTLNTVAQAVWNAGLPMGVLPMGTFNYFARAWGMPTGLDEAVAALLHARVAPVPVGLLGERVFLVNASVGLYPQLLLDREDAKQRFGRHRLVALLSGLGTVLRGGSVLTLELHTQGHTRVVRTRTLFVGNNELQLRALGLPEAVQVQRGRLAAITLQPLPWWRTLWLAARGMAGRLGGSQGVDSFAFDELLVRPRRGVRHMRVALDGEVSRMAAPLVFRSAPQPLRLLLPADAPEPAT